MKTYSNTLGALLFLILLTGTRAHTPASEIHVGAFSQAARKKGDDYPARIYVTFDYDPSRLSLGSRIKYKALRVLGYKDIPLRALNYIWANRAPVGTMVDNPYTKWVTMIAVQSGAEQANTWHLEMRNLYEDYKAAFGEEPGAITGIAVMTDTDNTGESAMAYYGDITLRSAP